MLNYHFSLALILHLDAELTDTMLVELSTRMTSPGQLRRLVTIGLGVRQYFQDSSLHNKSDINEAALTVFKQWNLSQHSPAVAYNRLREALIKVDMCCLIHEVLEGCG